MLKKANRLTKNKEFDQLFATGRSAYGGLVGFKYAENKVGFFRASVIIGKKVSKKAVVRNKLKRQIKEVLRLNLPKLTAVDLIVITMPIIAKAPYTAIKAELENLLKRQGLIK